MTRNTRVTSQVYRARQSMRADMVFRVRARWNNPRFHIIHRPRLSFPQYIRLLCHAFDKKPLVLYVKQRGRAAIFSLCDWYELFEHDQSSEKHPAAEYTASNISRHVGRDIAGSYIRA